MFLRCLLPILIATASISHAENVNCKYTATPDHGLQCELHNIHIPEKASFRITNINSSVNAAVFHDCSLYKIPENLFTDFPQLKYLNVDSMHLKVIKANNFHNANQLRYFMARSNELSELESETFSSSSQLKLIVLQHNRISFIHSRAFYGLNNLEVLVLDHNQLKSLPESLLEYTPNLLYFSVAYNNLTSIPDDLFTMTKNLESLNLGHNLLTSFDDEQFHELAHLELVQLDHNKLSELNLVACRAAEIHIDNNELSEIELNKWTKVVTAWGNPVKKFILHEHYGTSRSYNFSFHNVSEIVFFVHEHCCSVENLENFYILTMSFGDLSEKNLDVNDWNCMFRRNVGYQSDKGYVTNNVCERNEMSIKKLSLNSQTSTTNSPMFVPGFNTESAETTDEYSAVVEESTTEPSAKKGLWKSLKKKVGGWRSNVVNKWNSWVG